MAFERRLTYKIYAEDGTFVEVLDDVVSDFTIKKQINGGDSEFVFELDRKMDDFDEGTSVKFNNRVKVYLKDTHNPLGDKLIAYGYIVSYKPFLQGKKEGVEVTCLSAISKLSNDFYRLGTFADASNAADPANLAKELTSNRADEMMEDIIDHYRLVETNSMLSNDYANVDQTTDNSGSLYSFDLRFFNMKHIDAIRNVSKFLPRNKTGGYWFYWRIDTDGKLYLKNVSSTADHTFHISRHIKEISGRKSIEGVVNRVYFYNEKGASDPDYLQLTADDSTSQGNYDIMAEYITDSKITYPTAASLLSSSKVYDKKDPKVRLEVTLNGAYDLSSIKPGDTCNILNAKNNPFNVGADDILIIHSMEYSVDEVKLVLAEASDNFEDIVEDERQRLDKEMTWFGYITQQLTAAQLGPANKSWSTDIIFSATSGADAYRKVDWTTGTVYLPAGASGSAGKRVIDVGTTGLMTASTDYFIYLDEETINTSASDELSGAGTAGIVKQGGDALYDSSKSWSNDQYKGYIVTIGAETKIIRSNTSTVLSIEDRWTIADTTGAYTIKKMTMVTSTSEETISDLTKIVFSNVRANSLITSEAIITTTQGASTVNNYNIDGTQIAKRSISANEIVADTITAYEILSGSLTLTDISNDATYGKTTLDEVTGANRGFNALNSSNRYKTWIDGNELTTGSNPSTGIILDYTGIRGYASGTKTFEIERSSGNAYFRGEIATGSSGDYIRLSTSPSNKIEFFYDSSTWGSIECGYNPVNDMTDITIQSGGGAYLGISGKSNMGSAMIGLDVGTNDYAYFGPSWSGGSFSTVKLDSFAVIAAVTQVLRLDDHWMPYITNNKDLGSSTYKWKDIYLAGNITVGGTVDGVDVYNHTHSGAGQGGTVGLTSISINGTLNMGSYTTWLDDTVVKDRMEVDQDVWEGGTRSLLVSNYVYNGFGYADGWDVYSEYTEVEKVHQDYMRMTKTEAKEQILLDIKEEQELIIRAIRKDVRRFAFKYKKKKGVKSKIKLTAKERELQIKKYEKRVLENKDWSDEVNDRFAMKRYSTLKKGTILAFSDEGAIPTTKKGQTNIMGVISTHPCFTAYAEDEGMQITKHGHTFVRVKGTCNAGDFLGVSDEAGCAEKITSPSIGQVVGRARKSKTTRYVEILDVDLTIS